MNELPAGSGLAHMELLLVRSFAEDDGEFDSSVLVNQRVAEGSESSSVVFNDSRLLLPNPAHIRSRERRAWHARNVPAGESVAEVNMSLSCLLREVLEGEDIKGNDILFT
jgi:hypothetical protein